MSVGGDLKNIYQANMTHCRPTKVIIIKSGTFFKPRTLVNLLCLRHRAYSLLWHVRAITSSCCSLVRLMNLTA